MTTNTEIPTTSAEGLAARFAETRRLTEQLAAPLGPEDQTVQSMPEVSPTKWHRAHTTWFFETFVLGPHLDRYRPVHPTYDFLFNSYYEQIGARHQRHRRGVITRPTAVEVGEYRSAVDRAVLALLDEASEDTLRVLGPLIELGIHHEQQHQELLLMDIKHVFWCNPLRPAYRLGTTATKDPSPEPLRWIDVSVGDDDRVRIGHEGDGFAFDNESPAHDVIVPPFALGHRLVTEGEWLGFIEDGGYRRAELWLSDGWAQVQAERWSAPLYWEHGDAGWSVFTLGGARPLRKAAPVTHVSFFEADAFATWAGVRLPTEQEWEVASRVAAAGDPPNDLGAGALHPRPTTATGDGVGQLVGDGWEWTASAYRPYPGFRPAAGAIGEYNGKFMSGQMVLRGGAPVTPRAHTRRTYRNFYPPSARWPFTTVRLARDRTRRHPSERDRAGRVSTDDSVTATTAPVAALTVPPVVDVHLSEADLEAGLAEDVARGFAAPQARLSPKWLYDDRGSELFDRITRLDAYYPTRREGEILEREAVTIAEVSGADTIVELGSGTSHKTELLLDAAARTGRLQRYLPFDVSEGTLRASAARISEAHPGVQVHAVVGDFDRHLDLLPGGGTRLVVFLGGTIGNYERTERAEMLDRLATVMNSGDALLLGTDLVKDPDRLLLAYDDPAGVTAEFDRNILRVLTDRLGARLDLDGWRHRAVWDEDQEQMEMHLVAVGPQRVEIPSVGIDRRFADGEHIHTETSAKFRRAGVDAELRAAGLSVTRWWTDERGDFGLTLAVKP